MADIFQHFLMPFWAGVLAYLVGTMILRNILDRFLKGIVAPIVIVFGVILIGPSQFEIASANVVPYGIGALSTFFTYERLKKLPEGIQIIIWVGIVLSPLLYFAALGLFG